MRNILKTTLMAAALALTGAATTVAHADSLELHFGQGGPTVRMREDCNPYRENCRTGRWSYRDNEWRDGGPRSDNRGWARRECPPERALAKADRMGIQRARILDVGRRTIDIGGRSRYGDRVVVSFGRWDRSCPVYR